MYGIKSASILKTLCMKNQIGAKDISASICPRILESTRFQDHLGQLKSHMLADSIHSPYF